MAVDTETTGVTKDSQCVGYSFSAEEHIGIYIVLAHWEASVEKHTCPACNGVKGDIILTKTGKPAKNQKLCKKCGGNGTVDVQTGKLVYNQELKAASKEIFEILKTKKLIMHNSPFDCDVIDREFKIELIESVHTDTMELAHILDENERCALKEVGSRLFGEDAKEEAELMKASVIANGGSWTQENKEMFKADKELLGRYGAKDTVLTLKIFYTLIPELFEQGLDTFFYDEETMPLMRGPTYQMNKTGMKVDLPHMKSIGADLHDECTRLKREVEELVAPLVSGEDWPFKTDKVRTKFSVTSNPQISWLLFIKLNEPFNTLTKGGKPICKDLIGKLPYTFKAKREFIQAALESGNPKWKPWKLMQADADTLEPFTKKYEWVKKIIELRQAAKMLSTYVEPIVNKSRYGIVNPSFLQAGTVTGRYSSNKPNFQNLPRDDTRIKKGIIARPGRCFVGADYSQLEPRVFASVSQDIDLMGCFAKGEDFYSVVGAPIFGKDDCSMIKDDPNSFATLYKSLRNDAKAFALATPYGTSAFQQAQKLGLPQARCQEIIDAYLERYPSVYQMMLDSYEMVMTQGVVFNLYGRPRRLPEGLTIREIYGDTPHGELPYAVRSILNSAMNFRVQGSAGSIVNRAMIAFYRKAKQLGIDAKIILQVHDEIVVECALADAEIVKAALQDAMENTTVLPGVVLVANPVVAYNLADLK